MTVIPLGTQKQQDVPLAKERGLQPPWVLWKGEQKTEGQQQVPKEWQDTRRHFAWPHHACGRRAPSWQQDRAGGPGLAWAGDTQGLSPGVGRDGGAGFHKVPWQVHFIPPRASSLGVRHPSPNSADVALCPHQASCGSPRICLCSQRSLQHHPTPSPSWGTVCAWCFFGISYLRHGQAKHFRRHSRAACAWGPMGNPGNITKAAKKTKTHN